MQQQLLNLLKLQHRKLFIGFLLLGVGAILISDFHVENRIDAWIGKQGPDFRNYQRFVREFGNDESLIAVFSRRDVSAAKLDDYLALMEQLQSRTDIATLYDPVNLLLVNALGELPDERDLSALRLRLNQAQSAPLHALISDDLDTLGLVILFKPHHEAARQASFRQLAGGLARLHIAARFGGTQYFSHTLTQTISRDLRRVIAGLVSLSILVLFWFFRKWQLVVAILAGVALSLIYTIAGATALGVPITLVTLILFPLVFLVSMSTAIHLYARRSDGIWRLSEAYPKVLKPAFVAALTTALGVSSFAFAPQQALAETGMILPIGVLLSFFVSMLFTPAAQRVLIGNWELPKLQGRAHPPRRSLRRPISLGLLAASIAALLVLPRIKSDPDAIGFFPADSTLVRSYRYIESHLTGLLVMDLVIRATDQRPPDTARHARDLNNFLRLTSSLPAWTHTISGLALAQHAAGDPLARDWLRHFVAGQDVRVSLHFRNSAGVYFPDLARAIQRLWDSTVHPGLNLRITGILPLTLLAQSRLLHIQALVFPTALALISLILWVLLHDRRVFLLALLANVLPLLLAAGSMVALSMRINSINLFVASVIFGVVVDDTIHLLHAWQAHGSMESALAEVHPAIRMTTLTVLVAFTSLFLSQLTPLVEFAALSMIAVATAYLCDVYLIPALLEKRT